MRLIGLYCVILYSAAVASSKCGLDDLKKQIKKVGCFHDSNHDMKLLINGHSNIDWNQFGDSTNGLLCDCIDKARAQGFDYIQIGYFGYCSGGKNFEQALIHRQKKPSLECVNVHYSMCSDKSSHYCVGTDETGYIYQISGGPIDVNGGLTAWSDWTKCSVTCGEGVQNRGRQCTKPVPRGNGNDCSNLGPLTEAKACSMAQCAGAFIGDASFVSKNYPAYKLGENSKQEGFIMTGSVQEFHMVTGLTGKAGTVSFKTRGDGRFLRHRYGKVHFDKNDGSNLFKWDATFYLRPNVFRHGYHSLEASNYRGAYLRHSYMRVILNYPDGTELYKDDASFLLVKNEDKFRDVGALLSYNYRSYCIGENSRQEGFIVAGAMQKFKMIKGLNGRANTVTFVLNGRYLRHRYGLVHFDKYENSQLFKDDASFFIHENKYFNGFVSLEASNYPGAFLRHQNYRMKLHYPNNSLLFKQDASFLLVRTHT